LIREVAFQIAQSFSFKQMRTDLSKFLVEGGLLRGSVGKNIVLTGIGFTVVPDTHMRVSAAGILRKLGQQTLHPPGYGR